ncbi:hypothetical protein M2319_000916 [Rhodobium gokarnense]|uniref:Uncharacterized protein n=1 Tax=Rhodobium gokarnense TaxID=364296 RepID=A0ABT3H871_9HYPH|nr:hypothetical protein [Rhodobium gokarnense]
MGDLTLYFYRDFRRQKFSPDVSTECGDGAQEARLGCAALGKSFSGMRADRRLKRRRHPPRRHPGRSAAESRDPLPASTRYAIATPEQAVPHAGAEPCPSAAYRVDRGNRPRVRPGVTAEDVADGGVQATGAARHRPCRDAGLLHFVRNADGNSLNISTSLQGTEGRERSAIRSEAVIASAAKRSGTRRTPACRSSRTTYPYFCR